MPFGSDKMDDKVQGEYVLHDEIFDLEVFLDRGCLGSHSLQKLASIQARKNGCCQEDQEDLRGPSEKSKNVPDVYDDINLPFLPDAKIAGKLCTCVWILQVYGDGGQRCYGQFSA